MSHSFNKYVNEQHLKLHIDCLKSILGNDIDITDISGKHKKHKDLLLKKKLDSAEAFVECKLDKPNTQNICLELVGVCYSLLGNQEYNVASTKPFYPGSKQHKMLINLFEEKKNGKIIEGESLGFCFEEDDGNFLLSSIRSSKDMIYLFNRRKIQPYLQQRYAALPVIVTHSINDKTKENWHTISSLVGEKEIQSSNVLCSRFPQKISDLGISIPKELIRK